MRLACVTTHPIQYHAHWFRELTAQPGLDLEVLYCHQASPQEQAEAGFGVEFEWDIPLLGGYRHRFLRNVAMRPTVAGFSGLDTPEVVDLISREGYDAVMVNGWHYKSAWQAIRACWKHQIPVMVRSDSHLHTARHPLKSWAKELPYRWFIRRLDACLAVGTWSADYFRHYGAPAQRIFKVPHAVNALPEAELKVLEQQRPEFRARWNLTKEDFVFAFAGKFIAKKRPLDLIRALGKVRRQGGRVCGLMIGDGPLRGECEQLSHELDVPVRFTGFLNQSEITKAYIASDALVLPSDGGETWGLVVNEVMSIGRPCLVSDHVGCGPDLIRDGETGYVFPLDDVDSLAAVLARCAAEPDKIMRMRGNARRLIAEWSTASAVHGVLAALNYLEVGPS